MKITRNRVLLSAMVIVVLLTTNVYASQTVDGSTDAEILVQGNVEATTITVTVPTSLSFTIAPDNVDSFNSVPFDVENDTKAPVTVKFLGFKADAGTSAKVVENDAFTDVEWSNLGVSDTNANIALGINEVGEPIIWSAAETAGNPSTVLGSIDIDNLDSTQMEIGAKYGNAWGSAKTLEYRLFLRVSLAD